VIPDGDKPSPAIHAVFGPSESRGTPPFDEIRALSKVEGVTDTMK